MMDTTFTVKPHALKPERVLNQHALRRGFTLFIFMTVLGLAIVFFATQTPETVEIIRRLDGRYFLVAIALAALDMLVGGWRNHIFIRKVKDGVSSWLSFRANVANIFLSAVTPSSSGGGPAQLFIFCRGGVAISKSLPIAMINFIATMVFFLVAGLTAAVLMPNQVASDLSTYLLRSVITLVAGLLALYLCLLWRPAMLGRIVGRCARFVLRFNQRAGSTILKLSTKLLGEVGNFQACCQYLLRRNPRLLLYSFGLTIVLYVNKLIIGYFLLRCLGFNADILSVMVIQLIILITLYFSPSPGGSGIAELSIATLMSALVPGFALSLYAPLHRFFLLYLPALLGAGVMLKELRSQSSHSQQYM